MFLKVAKIKCPINVSLKNNRVLKVMPFILTIPKSELRLNMLNSFKSFKLSKNEKKELTLHHRKYLNTFQNPNLFEIKKNSLELASFINSIDEKEIWIEANELSVWICLAAIYSGQIKTKAKVHFNFTRAPMGLFPKSLMIEKAHQKSILYFHENEDYWPNKIDPFIQNQSLKIKYLKAS